MEAEQKDVHLKAMLEHRAEQAAWLEEREGGGGEQKARSQQTDGAGVQQKARWE